MCEQKKVENLLKTTKIYSSKYEYFYTLYKKSNIMFLNEIIKHDVTHKQLFIDRYIKGLTINKLSRKYLLTTSQISLYLNSVMNLQLYLELPSCEIIFKDPLYERREFDQLCVDVLGLKYEPIRWLLIKKYQLIEKTKDNQIYILKEHEFSQYQIKQQDEPTNKVDLKLEYKKITDFFDEIIINDVVYMKKYIDQAQANLKPKHYQKFYEYVKNKYYKNGYNSYINKKRAMLSREWSLSKISSKVPFKREEINFVLYDDIKSKND